MSQDLPLDAIAIVGMAGRFPEASGIDELWENLLARRHSVRRFEAEELEASGVSRQLLANPRYVPARGQLDGADRFDATFFGYSPAEAKLLDPQQRLFLECAWHALEDAGHGDTAGAPVGVFAGTGLDSYLLLQVAPQLDLLGTDDYTGIVTAHEKDFLATRVAYKLDLRGPAITVQTACSTSLVAIHLACQSLLSGECDLALAGGVSVVALPLGYVSLEGGVFSRDGHTRSFAEGATGFAPGSGLGAVVLRRLGDAVADGDTIRAVIRGSAINNDGAAKVGFTATSVEAQAAVIAEAIAVAGISPRSIGYVEAHGAGTEMGDQVEIAALTRAFRRSTSDRGFCRIGSIKSNIGHLDTAAGIAGLIKTSLALERGQIPPSLHCEVPQPALDLASTPFDIASEAIPWPPGEEPRRAAVSSLGLGGTNAHLILEEAPAREALEPSPPPWHLLTLSALDENALDAATANLQDHLARHPELDLADVAHTLAVGRRELPTRRVVVCRDTADAAQALGAEQALGTGQTLGTERRMWSGRAVARERPVVFMFPGGGAQHPTMGSGLYADGGIFRQELDRCRQLLRSELGVDLGRALDQRGDDAARLQSTPVLGLASLFSTEYALARQWLAWGVTPEAMIGHSLGEYVAATLAGVFSPRDALAVVVERGRLFESLGGGAMLSVSLPALETQARLSKGLSLAAVNAPDFCVVSGPRAEVESLAQRLTLERVESSLLHIDVAAHSSMLNPILEPFRRFMDGVTKQEPTLPFISNVTGDWITEEQARSTDYWVQHLASTVQFADGLATATATATAEGKVLLEVGPGDTLCTLARAAGQKFALPSLPAPRSEIEDRPFVLSTLGRLWTAGVAIDWPAFHPPGRRRIPLPGYPFQRQPFWIDPPKATGRVTTAVRLGERCSDPADWFHTPVWRPAARPLATTRPKGRWLVLGGGELGDAVAEALDATVGDARSSVLRVAAGGAFTRPEANRFLVDPMDPDQLQELFQELRAEGEVTHIVSLWDSERIEARDPTTGFFRLMELTRQLARLGDEDKIQLSVITAGAQAVGCDEAPDPAHGPVLGAARVVPRELPRVACRRIDLAAKAQNGEVEALVTRLLETDDPTDGSPARSGPELAFRQGQWWSLTYLPIRLDPPEEADLPLRDGGVYWILGGLGGIGRELARFLATEVRAAKIVLSGRSNPNEDDLAWLAELQDLGAEARVLPLDIADPLQVVETLATIRAEMGEVRGLIQAAGMPAGGLFALRERADAEAVFAPKIEGTENLARALGDVADFDFFVLCSALDAVVGTFGLADHSAANAFLDSWARGASSGRVISIGWQAWREVGQADATDVPEALQPWRDLTLKQGLSNTEGVEVFRRALGHGLPQVVVSTVPLEDHFRRMAELDLDRDDDASQSESTHDRPDLQIAYAAPSNDVEQELVSVLEELLGVKPVGIHDSFFELGGHSLLALRLVARLKDSFEVSLPLASLIAKPTAAEMAMLVEERLIERLEGMSDEEAAAVLGLDEGS